MKIKDAYPERKFLIQLDNNKFFISENQEKTQVIIKVAAENLSTEYDLAKKLDNRFLQAQKVRRFDDGSVLEIPYDQEILLSEFIKKGELDIPTFFKIGKELINLLASVHKHNMALNTLNPFMLLINQDTLNIKLLDWSRITLFERISMQLDSEYLYKYAEYVAPEQTGLLNKPIDYRADYYCLGIIMYQVLIGQTPFIAENPLEILHQQIAITPNVEQISDVISPIILKLLTKDPEERYQSIKGLTFDFNKAEEIWKSGSSETFTPGTKDISYYFHIPEKVYGREEEKNILEQVYNQSCQNKTQLVLVSGYSGIGKTTLVGELQPSVAIKKGFFISGKYDLLKRTTAYSGISEALSQLCKMLLTEPEENINQWKEKILNSLGRNGRILIDILPELEFIIGPQSELPEMSLEVRQNLFNISLIKFINIFTEKECSLVIFLDDLQWVDIPSLNALKSLINFQQKQKLMIIGAYRSNEVDATHPLTTFFIKDLKRGVISVTEIELEPLKTQYIKKLCSETFKKPEEEVAKLSEIVEKKTNNNPFFVKVFLKNLYDNRLISFSEEAGWHWNIEEILRQPITENVAILVSSIIYKFDEKTRELVIDGSFLGSTFRSADLQIISEFTEKEIEELIQTALSAGIIVVRDGSYKFAHDRFRETAYSLVKEHERPEKHLKIARKLYNAFVQINLEERIIDILQQYNRAIELVTDKEELLLIMSLNLKGATKAKFNHAYNIGVQYLEKIMQIFSEKKLEPEVLWQQEYELMLQIHREYAELLYFNYRYEESKNIINQAIPHIQNIFDRNELKRNLLVQYMTKTQFREAFNLGVEILNELGIEFPLDNYEEAFNAELEWNKKYMANRPVSSILDLLDATDPKIILALKVFNNMINAAMYVTFYSNNINPWGISAVKAVNLVLKYGLIPGCSSIFIMFASVLNNISSKYDENYEYGKVAIELSFKKDNLSQIGQNLYLKAMFLDTRMKPLKEVINSVQEAYKYSYEAGDLENTGYCAGGSNPLAYVAGVPFEKMFKKIEETMDFANKTGHTTAALLALPAAIMVWTLSGHTANRYTFSYKEIDEENFFNQIKKTNYMMPLRVYRHLKTQAYYFYEDFEQGLKWIEKSKGRDSIITGGLSETVFFFYEALTLIALYPSRGVDTQTKYKETIEKNLETFKNWKRYCPENFEHYYLMLKAEYENRILGKTDVVNDYETAISRAANTGFIQNEALASELYAKYWLRRENKEIAQIYFYKARDLYEEWGASRKIECLEEFYRDIFTLATIHPRHHITPAVLTDYETVLNTTYTLAEELNLDALIEKMIVILGKNAGIQYTAIVLPQAKNLYRTVTYYPALNKVESHCLEDKDLSSFLPASMFYYINRTGETVLINEIQKENIYSQDPYFLKNFPKSCLGLPIKKEDRIYGVIYFENQKIIKAFDESRIELLKTLLVQCAISIENATLYKSSQESKKIIEKTAHKETILREIISEIKLTRDLNEAYQKLLWKVAEKFGLNRVLFLESSGINPNELFVKYEFVVNSGELSLKNETLPEIYTEPFFNLIHNLKPLVINNINEHYSNEDLVFFEKYKVNALLAVPLVKYNKNVRVLGFVVLCSKEIKMWTTDEIELIKAINSSVVSVIWEISTFIEIENLRNSFISTLAHDFQVPIIGERAALEYLLKYMGKTPLKSKEIVEELIQNNLNITTLLNKSIEIYNYESGKTKLTLYLIQISEVLNESIDSLIRLADSRSVNILLHTSHCSLWRIKMN